MYVKSIFMEDMEMITTTCSGEEISNPSWEEIESGIRKLDGNRRSLLSLRPTDPDDGFMGIGGGKDGLYCCFAYDKEGREFGLIDPSQTSDEYVDVLMGQTTSVSLKECVTLDIVLMAAKTYAESGKLDSRLSWRVCPS